MKTLVAFIAGVLVAGLLLSFAHGAGAASWPPDGVAADNWVPIGESLGLVLVENPAKEGIVFPRSQGQPLAGRFVVKHGGRWNSLVVVGPVPVLAGPP